MSQPLEFKVSIKDLEPFNEFLGSLEEFQKAIYKLSGKRSYNNDTITSKRLEEIGFMNTLVGYSILKSNPDSTISLTVKFVSQENPCEVILSSRIGFDKEHSIHIKKGTATMKDINNLIETFELGFKQVKFN